MKLSQPLFTNPFSKKTTLIPAEVKVDDGKTLTFVRPKTAGDSAGGWYRDDSGKEFMVKFEEKNPYLEKLLNNLAAIAVGEEFVSTNNLTGTCEFGGKISACFIAGEIPGYSDISAIPTLLERQLHAKKFHPTFAFNALIHFDDTNEGNLGLGTNGQAKIIDFGNIPQFLLPEQKEHADSTYQLASFIGHRSSRGLQTLRNRYFGYDGFLNPMQKKDWEKLLAPEDISYYDVLSGVKKIVQRKDEILAEISKTIFELEGASIDSAEKSKYLQELKNFSEIMARRIDDMKGVFKQEDLENCEAKREKFFNIKWRSRPEFAHLMEKEQVIFKKWAKEDLARNFEDLSKISKLSKGETLEIKEFDEATKKDLRQYIDKNCVLHNAVMNGDLKAVKWLLNNDLADINKVTNLKKHNYQFHRLTPLDVAIAIYHDRLTYDTAKSAAGKEMIDFLKEKFFEKNGKTEEEYKGGDKSVKMTFDVLKTYQERSSQVEREAATKIQTVFRDLQVRKVEKLDLGHGENEKS